MAEERASHARQIATLKDDSLLTMSQAVAARTEAERRRIEVIELQERITSVQRTLESTGREVATLEAQRIVSDAALREGTEQLAEARARVESLAASVEELQKRLTATVERERALVRANTALENHLAEQRNHVASLESQLAGKHNYIGSLEAQVEANRVEIAALEAALAAGNEAAQSAQEVERLQFGDRLAAVEQELAATRAEADNLRTQAAEHLQVKDRLGVVERELLAARTAADSYMSKAAETQSKFDKLEGDHNWLKERWEATRVPPLLITTMPRSGTYYISRLFSDGLRIKSQIVSNQYFPSDTIRYHALKEFANGNYVSQDHFEASKINLTHISHYGGRVLCHVRDPRQAMLSWIHHIEQYKENAETYLFIYPPLPESYYGYSLERKIDWAIDNWLPLLVRWTEDWVAVADGDGPVKVKMTHYEEMIRDEKAFITDVLDFFSVPRERFIPTKIELGEDVHFRKGDADEWKTVFTSAQRTKATALIPNDLMVRMGWSPAP